MKRHICIYLTNEKGSEMRERKRTKVRESERQRKRSRRGEELIEILSMTILHGRFWITISLIRVLQLITFQPCVIIIRQVPLQFAFVVTVV